MSSRIDAKVGWKKATGGFSVFAAAFILFVVGVLVWIHFFDSDGGEPGSATIFSVIGIFPIWLGVIIAWAIAGVRFTIFGRVTLRSAALSLVGLLIFWLWN